MKEQVLYVLDVMASILDHRVFGWLVWVGIVVCERMDVPWASVVGAGLLATKTYLSGTWAKKGNGHEKAA